KNVRADNTNKITKLAGLAPAGIIAPDAGLKACVFKRTMRSLSHIKVGFYPHTVPLVKKKLTNI
ncbi:MAG: hypothetical protein ACK48P_00820, partial [Holosporales bacterium]